MNKNFNADLGIIKVKVKVNWFQSSQKLFCFSGGCQPGHPQLPTMASPIAVASSRQSRFIMHLRKTLMLIFVYNDAFQDENIKTSIRICILRTSSRKLESRIARQLDSLTAW